MKIPTYLYLCEKCLVMKKLLIFLLVVVAAFVIWKFFIQDKKSGVKDPKLEPIVLQKHSDTFNLRLDTMMDAYMKMKNAFVEADTAVVKQNALSFIQAIDFVPYDELQNDSARIGDAVRMVSEDLKSNAQIILSSNDVEQMRQAFSTTTELLYPGFLKMVNYEGKPLYIQQCPMAFDGGVTANWISYETQIMNPYLGKNHKRYKSSMLQCGEVIDSIVP